MSSGIGKSKVDDFHIVPDSGNHDIAWLEVTVDDAQIMQIGHGIKQLAQGTAPLSTGRRLFKPLPQVHAIDPLHDNAAAQRRHLLDIHSLHNAGMLHPHGDVKLLGQHFLTDGLVSDIGRKRLEHIPAAVTLGAGEHIFARRVHTLKVREPVAHTLKAIDQESRSRCPLVLYLLTHRSGSRQ